MDEPSAAASAREAFDHLVDGCQVIGFDWTYLYLNEAAVKQARQPSEQLVGRTVLACDPGLAATPMFASLQACMTQRTSQRLDHQVHFAAGARWFELRISPVPQGVCVLSADITDARRALEGAGERAAAVEARLASFIEQAPDGIFGADLEGRCTHVNGAACRLLGYSREELLGKTFAELVLPGEVARLWAERDKLAAGAEHVGEWVLRRKDGTVVPVEVSAKILADGRWQAFVRDITERRRAEQAIHQSEERLRLASQAAALGTFEFIFATGHSYLSPQTLKLNGLPEDFQVPPAIWPEASADAVLQRVHPDDRERVAGKVMTCLATNGERDFHDEHRLVWPDGTTRWVLVDARLFVEKQGALCHPLRVAGTIVDVTERKRLEADLHAAEAMSSGILAIAADGIVCFDAQQRITRFNQSAEHIFGFPAAEALGASMDILIPERFRAAHRPQVDLFGEGGAAKHGLSERVTPIGLRKSGEEFPLDATISRLELDGQTVFTMSLRDVTDQRRLERDRQFLAEVNAALAQTLDQQQTLRSLAHLFVRELADFCIVDLVSNGAARRLECTSRDPSKNWVCELLSNVTLAPDRPHLGLAAAQTKQPVVLPIVSDETIASYAQGDEHLRGLRGLEARSLLVVPVVAHGTVLGVIAVVGSRASGRTYGPAELHLAEEVARVTTLAMEKVQLYREAQRAIHARDDLLGIVAHDLRNPLQNVLLQARLLGDRARDGETWARKPSERIERSVSRMARLVQDLLDASRMEGGQLPLERVRVPVVQLVTEAVEAQKPLAVAGELELEVELEPGLPALWADRDRLLQVFENLIGNALKFAGRGVRVVVGAVRQGEEVVFRVSDTGPGVRAEDLPRLFERFWQSDRAARQGAGLGLPITKGIIEAHGGRIWVDSEPGQGTTFHFSLPVAPANGPEAGAPS